MHRPLEILKIHFHFLLKEKNWCTLSGCIIFYQCQKYFLVATWPVLVDSQLWFYFKMLFSQVKTSTATQCFHNHSGASPYQLSFYKLRREGHSQESHNEKWMLVLYDPICWELLCLTWNQVIQNEFSISDIWDSPEFMKREDVACISFTFHNRESERERDLKEITPSEAEK